LIEQQHKSGRARIWQTSVLNRQLVWSNREPGEAESTVGFSYNERVMFVSRLRTFTVPGNRTSLDILDSSGIVAVVAWPTHGVRLPDKQHTAGVPRKDRTRESLV